MVAEIEHARETGAGELGLAPSAVVVLRLDEVANAAAHGRMIGPAGGDQAQHGPGGLRGGDRPLAAEFGLIVAPRGLAPAAAGLLMGEQPLAPATIAGSSCGTPTATSPVRTCHVP